MRVLLDQGLPLSAATTLRQWGWTVEHVSEIGWACATDFQILDRARATSAMCVTLDSDFHALLAVAQSSMPSLVRIRQEGLKGPALAGLIQSVWERVGDDLARGAAVTVSEDRIRLRRLPILQSSL